MIGWCAGLAGCRAAGLNLRRRVLDGSPRGAAASVTQRRVVGLVRPVGDFPEGMGTLIQRGWWGTSSKT